MKKQAAILLALGLTLSTTAPAIAQSADSEPQKKVKENNKKAVEAKIKNLAKDHVNITWKADQDVPMFVSGKVSEKGIKTEKEIKQYLKANQDIYKLDPHLDLVLISQETDELGMTHYKYEQQYKNVPVDGTSFMVHTDKNGVISAINGDIQPEVMFDYKGKATSNLSKDEATKLAWKSINVKPEETEVEDPSAAQEPDFHSHVDNTTTSSETVLYQFEGNYYLAEKVTLQFIHPYPANWKVYINTEDGSVIDSYNAAAEYATTGSGTGVLGDSKTLNTYYSNGTYYLFDTTKAMNGVIETFTARNGSSLPGSYSVDADNKFTSTTQRADVDAHAYAGKVYDYFKNKHNRNSFNNAGATIRSTVHYGSNYNNAFWNGQQMVYGDGDGSQFRSLSGALDVVAHELTHAVTEYTAGLEYRNQSGALNESMSDLFAVFVEPDYLIGEDVYTPSISGDALRSVSDPTRYGQPAHMNNYNNTTADNGGVHINSGIPNKAGYYVISSLGTTKAEKIYYRALTRYLGPTSNFSAARAATLQAAADLYGSTSTEYNVVKSAWNNVGVY
ncbi:M4 family metallopeptidase [Bacillus suaedaesalsae]|uniref:Neutral metalloproteinase n=1 Tax=Bacillus suaedaesalsae TaxID=2810349 RepID=A0ABS2DCZ8_9BACI|nr:M4 family metallopeptidase [Bacillus suaedaesalsae]MBM6616304.1 peptidase M4 family protein [Bacillus suaedaesalsae]